MTFTLQTAETLVNTVEEFPVDFDKAWQWLGYSRKDAALKAYLGLGFRDNVDYSIDIRRNNLRGQPAVDYWISIDSLKLWSMQAPTEQGKQVRQYFLECERKLKAAMSKPMTAIEMLVIQAQAMAAIERQQIEQQKLLVLHDQRLEAVEYHTSGYEDYMSMKAYCNVSNIDIGDRSPSAVGKKLKKLTEDNGLKVKKIADAKYGEINAYPLTILSEFFCWPI